MKKISIVIVVVILVVAGIYGTLMYSTLQIAQSHNPMIPAGGTDIVISTGAVVPATRVDSVSSSGETRSIITGIV